jgi:hypothetical protein
MTLVPIAAVAALSAPSLALVLATTSAQCRRTAGTDLSEDQRRERHPLRPGGLISEEVR